MILGDMWSEHRPAPNYVRIKNHMIVSFHGVATPVATHTFPRFSRLCGYGIRTVG